MGRDSKQDQIDNIVSEILGEDSPATGEEGELDADEKIINRTQDGETDSEG